MRLLFIVFFFGFLNLVSSQEKLDLAKIMNGYDFIGHTPRNHFWSHDNKRIFFEWNPTKELDYSFYYWEEGFTFPKKLPLEDYHLLQLNDEAQKDKINKFYTKNGVLYHFNTKTNEHKKLIHTNRSISKIIPSKNENQVFFIQENNLFEYNLTNNTYLQLTNFKEGTENKDLNKERDFLSNQQVELFEYIRRKEAKKNYLNNLNEKTKEKFPKSIYYGTSELENIQISTDQRFVTFRLSEYPKNLETQYENYVTSTGKSTTKKAREKVSFYALSKHKLGVYDRQKDSVYFIDFKNLTNYNKIPAYLSLYTPNDYKKPEERHLVMQELIFDQKGLFTLMDIKSLDNKDRWIVNLNLETGQIEELDHQNDPAWIGGPGISEWNFVRGTLGFMKDNSSIYYQSEKTGFSHLYTMNLYSKKKVQLTEGFWEVRNVTYSDKKNTFYIAANKSHFGNLDFFTFNMNTGKLETICSKDGAHDVQISPDESKIAVLYSDKVNPWELYVGKLVPNTGLKKITNSVSKEFSEYKWIEPEVITFEGEGHTNVNARIYLPKKSNKGAVIFVHGAGYLQNAHNYWSTYYREYMFHNLLTEKGFTVLDIDYRGSDGYGRDFRTGIYRHMGGMDLSDHLTGRELLINKYGIDSTKIGIYGGSYGGFITLMALLTEPGKFKCGAALRSVTDWAHYNTEYTSNILNFPETDPEAYRKSSPIYFAENLKDELLMLHGMVDDNVQFQDVVRLSERFIELGKKNWNLAVYPVEAHGFKENFSWLDEYSRILDLFERNLLNK
jgi:acetyl esterase/lipase